MTPLDPLLLIDSTGPRRPRAHPRWRRRPWNALLRRARRRPAGWWLSLAVAAAAGAATSWSLVGAGPPPERAGAPPGATARPGADDGSPVLPDGTGALALPLDEQSLVLRPGDRVDLLATDLVTGRADVVARDGVVVEVRETSAAIAIERDALARAAAAVNQGLATPVLVERTTEGVQAAPP